MSSLNLPEDDRIPDLAHHLAAEAERRLRDEADLSGLRTRQLLETFVLVCEQKAGVVADRQQSLSARIGDLRGLPASVRHRDLHSVRVVTNEAVHVGRLVVRRPEVFRKEVKKALQTMITVWRAWVGLPSMPLRLPPAPDPRGAALDRLHALLDEAEDLADQLHQFREAEDRLVELDVAAAIKSGATADDLDVVELRKESIRRAIANHEGRPPGALNRARVGRLLASGDGRATDELVHLLNRDVVAALNTLDLEAAEARLAELTEWREASGQFRPPDLQDLQIRDWQLGALLGTRGQLRAFLAHAHNDADRLELALADFDAAARCFVEADDVQRQITYRLHALVEKARLGAELTPEEAVEVAGLVEAAPVQSLRSGGWDVSAFRVAACLKACHILGHRPGWLHTLQGQLDDWPPEPLPHPYAQVLGRLMLLTSNTPRAVRRAMAATAAEPGLIGWIAASLVADGSDVPLVPSALRGWWDKYGMASRAETGGARAVLPFNYA